MRDARTHNLFTAARAVRLISALLLAALAITLSLASAAALAQEPEGDPAALVASSEVVYSVTWGTCPWEVDAEGRLTVHAGVGADYDYGRQYYGYSYHSHGIVLT